MINIYINENKHFLYTFLTMRLLNNDKVLNYTYLRPMPSKLRRTCVYVVIAGVQISDQGVLQLLVKRGFEISHSVVRPTCGVRQQSRRFILFSARGCLTNAICTSFLVIGLICESERFEKRKYCKCWTNVIASWF